MEITPVDCYLSLGSNLGDRTKNLNEAINQLEKLSESRIQKSNFHQTSPQGFESSNNFINCCVKIITSMQPEELLKKLQTIEIQIGRKEKSNNGIYKDRFIDIDIIFYGQLIYSSKNLTIPHPLYQKRSFVLIPLLEINSRLIHPSTKISLEQSFRNISTK